MVRIPIGIGLGAAFAACSAASASYMLDNFTQGHPAETSAAYWVGTLPGVGAQATESDTFDPVGGVLGARRDITLAIVPGPSNSLVWAEIDHVEGLLSFSANVRSRATLQLDYGLGAPLNENVLGGGLTSLDIAVEFADLAGVDVIVTLTSNLGEIGEAQATRTLALPPVRPWLGETPQTISFDFADFLGVDLSDIDRISILFDASDVQGADFIISSISMVPPPGTFALLGIGSFLFVSRTPRAQAKQ